MKAGLAVLAIIFAFVLMLAPCSAQAAELPPAAGVASSEHAFSVDGSSVAGSATILENETVTSGNLPTRLNLNSGAELILGIGSRVKVSRGSLVLEGGSLDLLQAGGNPPELSSAGLRVIPNGRNASVSLYTAHPEELTVSVEKGSARVLNAQGTLLQELPEGALLTFAETRSEVRRDETQAPLRVAQIQARQIEHMNKVGEHHPGIREGARELWTTLAAASGGMLAASQLGGSGSPAAVAADPAAADNLAAAANLSAAARPQVNPETVRAATENVGDRLQTTTWGESGCGSGCNEFPLVTTNAFFGWVIGLPITGGGCLFCTGFF